MRRDLAAVGFAITFPTLAAWLYFVALAPGAGSGPSPLMQAVYAGSKVVQFGFPVIYLMLADRSGFREWGLSRKGVGLGVVFGLVVAAGVFPVFEVLRRVGLLDGVGEALRAKVTELGVPTPGAFAALAAFIALLHSGLEEYYWRGFVFGRLRMAIAFGPAVTVSSLGFMAHHVIILAVYMPGRLCSVAVPLSLCIAVGGAFWAWLYERSGSLLGPWVSHAVVDAAIMAVGWVLIFGG
jgi:membrane protease YdiL (CAAX protease family)